jgi:hypothetical protein
VNTQTPSEERLTEKKELFSEINASFQLEAENQKYIIIP